MKRLIKFVILASSLLSMASCSNSESRSAKEISGISISRYEEFDHAYIHVTMDELTKNGYKLGDTVDFSFSNGYKVDNVPLFDGYYGVKGDFLFVAYPTYEFPVLVKQYGECIIELGKLDPSRDTASIKLNTAGLKKDLQDTLSSKYSNDVKEFPSIEVFANYRDIKVGNIKPERLYRSASPVDNSANRATYVSELMKQDKIDYVFDLSNTREKQENFASKETTHQYWKDLFNNNQVFDCKVSANFYEDAYFPKIKVLCDGIIDNDGKYLFHCFEGKDRTGFVAILLEAICGATVEEIEKDYFVTYFNYYKLTKEKNPKQYNIFKEMRFYQMTNFFIGQNLNEKATTELLHNGSISYLKKCGLSENRINLLIDKLTK